MYPLSPIQAISSNWSWNYNCKYYWMKLNARLYILIPLISHRVHFSPLKTLPKRFQTNLLNGYLFALSSWPGCLLSTHPNIPNYNSITKFISSRTKASNLYQRPRRNIPVPLNVLIALGLYRHTFSVLLRWSAVQFVNFPAKGTFSGGLSFYSRLTAFPVTINRVVEWKLQAQHLMDMTLLRRALIFKTFSLLNLLCTSQ